MLRGRRHGYCSIIPSPRKNDERMIKEMKTSNVRIMKTMSEQFAQLALQSKERGNFPSQPEVILRMGSSFSSFDPNDVK